MTAEYCLNEMSRPQLFIWYAKTLKREYEEKQGQIRADWGRTANLLSMIHNTTMGVKRKLDPHKVMPEFVSFEEMMGNETKDKTNVLLDKADKLGLKTPSKKQI